MRSSIYLAEDHCFGHADIVFEKYSVLFLISGNHRGQENRWLWASLLGVSIPLACMVLAQNNWCYLVGACWILLPVYLFGTCWLVNLCRQDPNAAQTRR